MKTSSSTCLDRTASLRLLFLVFCFCCAPVFPCFLFLLCSCFSLFFVSIVLLLLSFFSVCYFNTLCQMLAFMYTCVIIQICMPYLNVQTFITCIYISFNVTLHISMHLCHTLYAICLLNTVDYRYLEVKGTLWNNLRYLYLDISDLQNWEKRKHTNM